MLVDGHVWIARAGGAHGTSSKGQEFSYEYRIPEDRVQPMFEFTNHTTGGTFKLECLTWLNYLRSRTCDAPPGEFDTVTLCGLGRWSGDKEDGLHVASVQICTSRQFPYVSVLIDGGATSNVNTKPAEMALSMP